MFVFRVLHTVPYSNEQGAKDLVTSLHAYFTCNLLIGFAVLISWKQFGGKPIECMLPPDFTSAWGQYAENYCWAQDTYFAPPKNASILNDTQKDEQKINYYQLMPFFLLFEAACFKFPTFIWKYFASQSGMRVGELLRTVTDDANTVPEVKKGNIEALCIHLQGALRFHKRLKKRHIVPHKVLRFLNVKYSTFYVSFIYILAKLAFFLNCGLQANLLNRYLLPTATDRFGYDIWKGLITGNVSWEESGVFPRVSLCDFEVREMGNVEKYTVQCVLLVNVFSEKIFMILWLWYHVLSAFTILNLISWVFVLCSETSKEHFIFRSLAMADDAFDKKLSHAERREEVKRFLGKYLGMDGMFLLHLIGQHADVVFTSELIAALWKKHNEVEVQRTAVKQMNRQLEPLVKPVSKPSSATTSPSRKVGVDVTDSPRKQSSRPHKTSQPSTPTTVRKSSSAVATSPSGRRRLSLSQKQQSLKRCLSETELEEDHVPFEISDDEDSPSSSKNSPKKSVAHSPSKKSVTHSPSKPEISRRKPSNWE